MMNKMIRLKSIDIKTIIIPFIVIVMVFIFSASLIIGNIEKHFYNELEETSYKLARGYSNNMATALQAEDVINSLLEEKLLLASETAALYSGIDSNSEVQEIAETLRVDEINIYNPQGQLMYSTTRSIIGWHAFEEHSVYKFIQGSNLRFVENIRENVVTGISYKYGYFKAQDGSIVQIGVLAERVKSFLKVFEMKALLSDILKEPNVLRVSYINNDLKIIESTQEDLSGTSIKDNLVISSIKDNENYAKLDHVKEEDVYEVYIPVAINGDKDGILAISQSLEETETLISNFTNILITALVIIFLSFIYFIISAHRKNKKLINMALYDRFTGLPNVDYLKEELAIDNKSNKHTNRALLLVNCTNFKNINMMFGYEQGYIIIKEIADRINKYINKEIRVYKFSSDRFILYDREYKEKNELVELTETILNLFKEPFKVNGVKEYILAQVGIVEIKDDYKDVDQLLKDALITMNYIDVDNILNYVFFDDKMEEKIKREESIVGEIRDILSSKDTDKFYMEYQPQYDLKTNRVVGFEALARMKSDYYGSIPPIEFIVLAEKNQLIIPLGKILLKKACIFLNSLHKKGLNDIRLSVNISAIQVQEEDFIENVLEIINGTGVDTSKLQFEITESAFLEDFALINQKLFELRKYKIDISIDDFGVGYSSFFRLSELEISELKIDKTFIDKINISKSNHFITDDIIAMAHKFNLRVVAEGVESEKEKTFLLNNDCDIIQGYLYSRPLAEGKALDLVDAFYK